MIETSDLWLLSSTELQIPLHDVPMQDFDQSILWHVKAETVGQFTGRSDKNGKDIYEGDICRLTLFDCNYYGTQYRVVVRWLNGAFYFANEDSGLYVCVGDVQDTNSDVEVIGNIYDDKLA